MAMMGKGAVVIWADLGALEQAAHDDWHSHEHLPERVGIPGFLRGRRAVSVDGSAPQIMAIYELDDLSTLTSAAYLERLDNPTPWSARIMGAVKQLSRTLCRVAATHGGGLGTQHLTLSLSPKEGHAGALRAWLVESVLPQLVNQPGITGAHLLERERSVEPPLTEEQRLRPRRDLQVDTVILIEGHDREALDALVTSALASSALLEHGAAGAADIGRWQLAHVMVSDDLPRP